VKLKNDQEKDKLEVFFLGKIPNYYQHSIKVPLYWV